MNANIYIIVIFPLLFQDEQIKIWLVTMFPSILSFIMSL